MAAARSSWTRFLASLDHIDAAIEAADPSVSRAEVRRLRAQIVETLRAAEEEEGIRAILDGVVEESLATLRSVPADAVARVLASSAADLAGAVGALTSRHGCSARVRGLARDVISGWKASVEGEIVRMTAAVAKLDALSPPPERSASSNVSDNLPLKRQGKIQQTRPPAKKTAPVVVAVGSGRAKASEVSTLLPKKTGLNPEERMEATKRKLHEGYREAADAKRQRKIKVVKAPKMLEQQMRQGKMHPVSRERSRDGFGAVRRSLLPSL
ncbi:hypothetical protein PR202_ga17965 [Eleusine coracana subsp. coracana]|uniref:TFIIS N-terminal domain-containing protein n=1 Tax=Eleusine coracana subsp. coracana TaxID=191504 RepID=A0AAV5CSF0_ELECO|nr:hypothetical protein QOZ80_6AG0511040 [Eleusine coracana subsp. coracana]GJN00760.1 hypothetical protein PR202_ga17965 [Eleusine coracana subsp. coracana]